MDFLKPQPQSILKLSLLASAFLLAACSNNDRDKNYYLTPEVTGRSISVSNVELPSGSVSSYNTDLSIGTISFSRSLVSKGLSSGMFGGWKHNYDSRLGTGGENYSDWQGVKSSRYTNAKQACVDGWDSIKNSAYNGQLSVAIPIFNKGLCDLYLDSEIVASLPVRNSGNSNIFLLQKLVQSNGSTVTFFKKNDEWVTTTRSQMKLRKSGDNWEVETASSDIQTYNNKGQLTKITSPSGQTTTLNYTDYLLSTVTGPFGHTLTLTYEDNRIAKVSGVTGDVTYHYDNEGKLKKVVAIDGAEATYTYTDSKLSSITNAVGNTIASYDYDAEGRVINVAGNGSLAKSIAYDTAGVAITSTLNQVSDTYEFVVNRGEMKVVSITNSDGEVETREYDANGYLTKVTEKNGRVTTSTYNKRGLLVSQTEYAGTTRARTILTEWHPNYPKPTKQVEPGKVTFSEYTDKGLLSKRIQGTVTPASKVKKLGAKGFNSLKLLKKSDLKADSIREQSFEYTENGQPKGTTAANGAKTEYTYNESGNSTSTKNALGQKFKVLEFDSAGRALKIQSIDGTITEKIYNKAGRILETSTNGQTTSYEYDAIGRKTKVHYPDGGESTNEYDAAGNLVKTIDHKGNITESTYDASRNQLSNRIIDASGNIITSSRSEYNTKNQLLRSIDAEGNITHFEYDKKGDQVKTTDARGNITLYEYDTKNRITKIIDALGGETSYEYDADDNQTKVIAPNGVVTEYSYDNFNQLITEKSADRGTTSYTYDVSGNQLSITNAKGDTKRMSYDLLGRKTGESWDNNPDLTVTYSYDICDNGVGKLCTVTDSSGSMSYDYNDAGQVIKTSNVIDGITLSKEYTYNEQDKLESETYPSGKVITYTYEIEKLTSISVAGSVIISSIKYNASHQLLGWTWSDGTTYTKTYDSVGRLKTFPLAATTRTLRYDALSNITGWNDSNKDEYKIFDYDSVNRLSGFTKSKSLPLPEIKEDLQKQVFEYDANGNRLTLTEGVTDTPIITIYSILEDSNRLKSVDDIVFQYDANGNITNDGEHDYHYDARNRLSQVDENHQYFYNANNMRVKKVSDGNTTLYAWDNEHIYAEYDQNGFSIQETVYLGGTPIALLKEDQIYRIFADQIDTPRVITNQNNQSLWSWESKPFGETLPNEDVDSNGVNLNYNLRFPGQYFDQETKKHYNFNRDYNPVTGRYIQSDSIGLDGGINTFNYVLGSPLSLIDMSGNALTETHGKVLDISLDAHNGSEIAKAKRFVGCFKNISFTVYLFSWDATSIKSFVALGAEVGFHANGSTTVNQFNSFYKELIKHQKWGMPIAIHGNPKNRLNATLTTHIEKPEYNVFLIRLAQYNKKATALSTDIVPLFSVIPAAYAKYKQFKTNNEVKHLSHYFTHPNKETNVGTTQYKILEYFNNVNDDPKLKVICR